MTAMTRRQEIALILRNGRITLEDIAHRVRSSPRAVLVDLEHVRRSLRPPDRWIIHAAECHRCGFVFKDRERLNTPSRCPRCKSEDIREPQFEIGQE